MVNINFMKKRVLLLTHIGLFISGILVSHTYQVFKKDYEKEINRKNESRDTYFNYLTKYRMDSIDFENKKKKRDLILSNFKSFVDSEFRSKIDRVIEVDSMNLLRSKVYLEELRKEL